MSASIDWNSMLDELLDVEEGLSDSAVDFIESLARQREKGIDCAWAPSVKQITVLQGIYSEHETRTRAGEA